MQREWEEIHSFLNKKRSGNVLTKICTCMQINILNAQTNFHVSNCKSVDAASRKDDFDCQIYKMQGGLEMEEISIASNSVLDGNFHNSCPCYMRIVAAHC